MLREGRRKANRAAIFRTELFLNAQRDTCWRDKSAQFHLFNVILIKFAYFFPFVCSLSRKQKHYRASPVLRCGFRHQQRVGQRENIIKTAVAMPFPNANVPEHFGSEHFCSIKCYCCSMFGRVFHLLRRPAVTIAHSAPNTIIP